jgi:hypothetical protein
MLNWKSRRMKTKQSAMKYAVSPSRWSNVPNCKILECVIWSVSRLQFSLTKCYFNLDLWLWKTKDITHLPMRSMCTKVDGLVAPIVMSVDCILPIRFSHKLMLTSWTLTWSCKIRGPMVWSVPCLKGQSDTTNSTLQNNRCLPLIMLIERIQDPGTYCPICILTTESGQTDRKTDGALLFCL